MLMRQCVCGTMVEQGKRCPKCAQKYQKQYDRDKRDKGRAAFYHSKDWKRISDLVKARANGLDEYEFTQGHIVKGTNVHHIEPLSERPDLGLDVHNLILLSDLSHQIVHAEYAKGAEACEKMKQRLRDAVPPFGKFYV